MKLISTTVFIFINLLVFGQSEFDSTKIRKHILNRARKIPSYNNNIPSEYYRGKYDKIFKGANESELYELTNNLNPLVRRSALFVLVMRHSEKIPDLIEKNSGDSTQYFYIKFGDLGGYQTFIDELIDFLTIGSGFDKYFTLNTEQKKKITEISNKRKKEYRLKMFNSNREFTSEILHT